MSKTGRIAESIQSEPAVMFEPRKKMPRKTASYSKSYHESGDEQDDDSNRDEDYAADNGSPSSDFVENSCLESEEDEAIQLRPVLKRKTLDMKKNLGKTQPRKYLFIFRLIP